MKPQQLAARLNIASNTLRKWAGTDYAEFLSPNAAGFKGAARTFSDLDARILAWIAEMKARNTPANEILLSLQQAKKSDWRDLPPLPGAIAGDEPVALMPVEAAQERIMALQERYNLELGLIVKERDELKTQIGTLREENMTFQKRLTELATQEAELRGKLEQYAIGGHRFNAATLIIVALLIGAALAGVFLIVGHLLVR